MHTPTFLRRFLPALLLIGLALSSCITKDDDPRPNRKCGSTKTTTTPPGGNS